MPELPEVETIKRDLERYIQGESIEKIEVLDGRVIRNLRPRSFIHKCSGKKITDIRRRGKAIILQLDGLGYVVIQPMMTGHFIISSEPKVPPVTKDTKIIFRLCNQTSLLYNDQRLFGRIHYVTDLTQVKFLKTIGPEPFEKNFNTKWISQNLKRRTIPIKNLLLDQHFVAGIGNIYASEILFDSHIRPQRRSNSLTSKEVERLRKTTIQILKRAVRFRGTSMRNYRDSAGQEGKYRNRIKVYGRENQECVECHKPIVKIVQNGRSTFFCKKCQR